jgi:hypothetical protein
MEGLRPPAGPAGTVFHMHDVTEFSVVTKMWHSLGAKTASPADWAATWKPVWLDNHPREAGPHLGNIRPTGQA